MRTGALNRCPAGEISTTLLARASLSMKGGGKAILVSGWYRQFTLVGCWTAPGGITTLMPQCLCVCGIKHLR